MKKLYFRLLRLFNKGEPSRQEAAYALITCSPFSPALRFGKTTRLILTQYIYKYSLEEIAEHHNITRERVRQIIREVCR